MVFNLPFGSFPINNIISPVERERVEAGHSELIMVDYSGGTFEGLPG